MLSIKHLALIVSIVFVIPSSAFSATPAGVSELSQLSKNSWVEEIDHLVKQGDLIEAKNKCETIANSDLSGAEKKLAERTLQDINIKILFSPTITPNSFQYTVKAGDALSKIAKVNNTTIELIKKSNHLKNDVIHEGMKLKIMKTNFNIMIDISNHALKLYADNELIKTYSVATGRTGHDTPTGTVTIVNKLENPVWWDKNIAYQPGDPKNILGTRWMGFSLKSYGIHGTTLPETVGTSASEGCIRMLNQEVEEIYSIIPVGTKVTLQE